MRTRARVPRLFARNERIVCLFDGERGAFAVILVGALFVGSMSTVWHGEITPWRGRAATVRDGPRRARLEPLGTAQPFQARGAELGRFNMGSTVLLLLPPRACDGSRRSRSARGFGWASRWRLPTA